jgi:hypothetical protein
MVIHNLLAFIFREENQVSQKTSFMTILQYRILEHYINMQLNDCLVRHDHHGSYAFHTEEGMGKETDLNLNPCI